MASNLIVAAVVLFAAVTQAADVCMGPGYYHLSCYTAAVSGAAAQAAKTQCFTAYGKAECAATLVAAPAGTGGCATPILYKFATAACRDGYQAQEKTNAACTQYTTAGLGAAPNRMTATTSADYACAARRLF